MILCTSDTEKNSKPADKTYVVYLLTAVFCVLFGTVYEHYSHEVYSFYMIYAFSFPMIGGVLPFSILHFVDERWYPSAYPRNLYHAGIATLTVGSIVQGVLEIYGTTNELTKCYWWAGISMVCVAALHYFLQLFSN